MTPVILWSPVMVHVFFILPYVMLGAPPDSDGQTAHTIATRPADSIAEDSSIVIFRDPERYATFPDVKRLSSDGRLLCVFRDASFPDRVRHIEADARIVGSLSRDGGLTWSKPHVIYDDPHCQNDPSVSVLSNGRLLMNFFNWVGRSEAYVDEHKPPFARRVDRGEWGVYAEPGGVHLLWGGPDPEKWAEDATRVVGTSAPLFATSSAVLETDKKTLLLPVYGRSVEQRIDRAYVLRSTDEGKSWSEPILIAADPEKKVAMQEPTLAQVTGGDIVVLMRTAHAGDHLHTTRSSDDGRTWAPAREIPLIGHPADMQVLPDGRLLAVYGYRHKPFGVRACISEDEGITWDRGREIVITDKGGHYDLGYPSVCMADEDHVVVVYYMNGPDTRDRWIECKRFRWSELP